MRTRKLKRQGKLRKKPPEERLRREKRSGLQKLNKPGSELKELLQRELKPREELDSKPRDRKQCARPASRRRD